MVKFSEQARNMNSSLLESKWKINLQTQPFGKLAENLIRAYLTFNAFNIQIN
jgi:hypothetical protein